MPMTYPTLLPKPFASNAGSPTYGGKNAIPTAASSPNASLDDGFPLATMTPISAGGVPPEGKDFNGILWLITQFQAWANGGGRFKYDAAFATATGGYPLGAVLMLSDNVSEVICVTNGTTNDPNSNMAGWAPYAGALDGAGFYQLDTGAVNAYVVSRAPAIAAYKNGMPVLFKAIHTNTAASTLDAGGGAVPLKRTDGAALVAGDVLNGTVYQAVYDAATSAFVLVGLVPSQLNAALFSTQTDVTGSRALGGTYTNSTGRPVHVSVTVLNGGAASNLTLNVDGVPQVTQGQAATGAVYSVTGIVPPGKSYSATISSGGTLQKWIEVS